jgi:hypothetical protein
MTGFTLGRNALVAERVSGVRKLGEQVGGASVIGLADLVAGGLDYGGQAPVRAGCSGACVAAGVDAVNTFRVSAGRFA